MDTGNASISKVTVEYHDPSGVFPLISKELQTRLPLRDLHWKSPARPLRSIEFLHVDLVPSKDTNPGTPGSRQGTPAAGQEDSPFTLAPEARRHQIPGLRQTPYLKIYLLRCDDSETYKTTSRKLVREWLKNHTPPSQSSSSKSAQDNHDAFEWLILHVVVPNTAAATQPRSSGSTAKNEGAQNEKSGGSKSLLGRSSNTILEKIKADFNVSSKSAPDRVSQIRVQPDKMSKNVLAAKPASSPVDYEEGSSEHAIAWHDLISKLKSLILSSFNLRVSQYEEDIRERNAQSAMPGWNFCTFFVLKEGLARGFESVGLVDDALVGYDELSLGLDHAIQDHQNGGASSRSDSFLAHTEELKQLLEKMEDNGPTAPVWETGAKVISPFKKGYPEMILTTNISIFDFQCYIFARQMTILLRMGILHSSELASLRKDTTSVTAPWQLAKAETDDLAPLSELCERTTTFIASISRVMRNDLLHAAESLNIKSPSALIDNIVTSWAFAVADQVLESTNSSSLSSARDRIFHDRSGNSQSLAGKGSGPAGESASTHKKAVPQNPGSILDRVGEKILSNSLSEQHASQATDLETLAGNRADLFMLQRQILERLAASQNWLIGLSRLRAGTSSKSDDLKEIDLSDASRTAEDEPAPISEPVQNGFPLQGIYQATLFSALSNFDRFRMLYEELTNFSLAHYLTATRKNAIERLIADLALVKFESGDHDAAVTYLSRVVPAYSEGQWGMIESSLAKVHAECLKKLNRRDDYVQMLLNLVARSVSREKSYLELRQRKRPLANYIGPWLDEDLMDTERSLDELILYSEALPYDRYVAMERFFSDINVEPYVRHFKDRDGFSLQIKFRHVLHESLTVDKTVMRLRMADGGSTREISLENGDAVELKTGINSIPVHANVTVFGTFTVEKITLKAKKISFEFEPSSTEEKVSVLTLPDETTHKSKLFKRMPRILFYPRSNALDVTVGVSREIHIDKRRHLEVECSTGQNQITRAELHLRSATAGLRLHTADATLERGEAQLSKARVTGVVEFTNASADAKLTMRIPYDLEDGQRRIVIGVDVTYHTPKGKFEYFSNPVISTELAVDVNVHDLFKTSALFSRFRIRTSKGMPLQILDADLEGNDRFDVEASPCKITPMLVFPKQEATLTYKIKQKPAQKGRQLIPEEKPLTLSLNYVCAQEAAILAIEKRFEEALSQTEFHHLNRVILRSLSTAMRKLNPEYYTQVALLDEIGTPDYDFVAWKSLLDHLPPSISKGLEAWLRNWHEKNRVFPITLPSSTKDSPTDLLQTITIAVPLPRLHILHAVSLSLPTSSTHLFSTGSLIPATVTISHTRQWDTPFSSEPLKFTYDIDAPVDTWLIGGQRRTKFVAKEDEVLTWTIMLMPLKSGRLLLPSMEVRLVDKTAANWTCETDYRSSAKTVVVIADVGTTTVGLSDGSGSSDAILMSSERRVKT
ncbi:TMEM1 family protein-like protein [Venturia nashicola]|nr:TMEM1 family protein-like protein [Venturia nashicola]